MGLLEWCTALLFFFLPIRIFAIPFNVTVDDTNGDQLTHTNVSYTPPASWFTTQDCASCDPCGNDCPPDIELNLVKDSTWHGSTFIPGDSTVFYNATFTFQGTGVYVYCILNAGLADSNMIFYLDGQQVGAYTYSSVNDENLPPYQYSVPVFQFDSLSNDNHTFTLTNGQNSVGNGIPSLVLLDYFQYTTELVEEQSPSSPIPTPTNAVSATTDGGINAKSRNVIIAIAVIAAVLLAAIIGLVFYSKRRLRAYDREVPIKSFDGPSFGEGRLLVEDVTSKSPGEGIVRPLLSPNRQMSSSERATSIDGVPQTSSDSDNQSPSRTPQLGTERSAMSGAFLTPTFVSGAGRAPAPPPGVPILDGPPPSPNHLRMIQESSAMEGRVSYYDEMQVPDPYEQPARSPPPRYWSRAGSFLRGGRSS
ncbi:hypothetical protein CERSUDRAFT_114502 [Gelatoporia subvermispora B]|uniref:Uncharacterized protein n=1 Tax=Ceriporiopsis subvermispora (strain B) TaxID=914234 RepID=M2RGC7_CERS8|nr:hypothetical protein CERSUDRAFT_114502 [Gelatoporia subvermispora B]